MKIGYARVSTEDQNLDMQRQALQQAGCERIFEDTISGAARKRSGLNRAMRSLKGKDVLVVWKLDRLGRSLPHLIDLLGVLGKRNVEFHSLSENIDTTTPGGRLVFHVMAALAEFERALISERTREGLAAARKRGTRIGRRKALCAMRLSGARARIDAGESVKSVAQSLKVGCSTLYRALHNTKS
jgi:Enterobacteriaceae phage serine recombinase